MTQRARLAAALALAFAALSGAAAADEELDVTLSGTTVTVTAKGGWHINKDYPWKLVAGDVKVDRTQFKLEETRATVTAPKGAVKLKGGICSEGQCRSFEKQLTVQ
ncbi:MAG: hypothetical protein FJ104_06545 [Deltaproteobacteria bacterium]|nr:hypothetical protein [Deltaproteobacteria bacterium]